MANISLLIADDVIRLVCILDEEPAGRIPPLPLLGEEEAGDEGPYPKLQR